MSIEERIKNKKIAIYAHNGGGSSGGWDDGLLGYLLELNVKEIIRVDFPFGRFSVSSSVRVNIYKKGCKCYSSQSFIKFHKPEPISYLKDFLYGIFYGFKFAKETDLFVGMDNLLALVGIILKKMGLIKKVAYCIIDYTPRRFKNPALNKLYYFIDKVACYNSDIVWPLNEVMIKGRAKDGKLDINRVKREVVPFGNNSDKYKDEDYNRYDKSKIVYFGGIMKSKGAELFVSIIQSLINRGMSNFVFECVGGGDLDYLKNEIKKNKLEKYFKIYGRVKEHKKVENILFRCGIAVAPYCPGDKNTFSYYADPGKVKVYLGCGLPIVITNVPPIAKEISVQNAGLIARYEGDDFADKILNINGKYSFYRDNSKKFGKEFAWSKIFNKALNSIL